MGKLCNVENVAAFSWVVSVWRCQCSIFCLVTAAGICPKTSRSSFRLFGLLRPAHGSWPAWVGLLLSCTLMIRMYQKYLWRNFQPYMKNWCISCFVFFFVNPSAKRAPLSVLFWLRLRVVPCRPRQATTKAQQGAVQSAAQCDLRPRCSSRCPCNTMMTVVVCARY